MLGCHNNEIHLFDATVKVNICQKKIVFKSTVQCSGKSTVKSKLNISAFLRPI